MPILHHRRNSFRGGGAPANTLLDNLVAFYKLDSNANDAHSTNNGTATNVTWDTVDYVFGTASGEFTTSAGSVIDIGASAVETAVDQGSAYTIAALFKADTIETTDGQFHYIYSFYKASSNRHFVKLRYSTALSSNELIAGYYDGAWQTHNTTFTDSSSWHLIAVTNNGTSSKMYLDGTEITENTFQSGIGGSVTNFLIGRGSSMSADMHIDNLGIRDVELSSTNLDALWNSGNFLDYGDFASS